MAAHVAHGLGIKVIGNYELGKTLGEGQFGKVKFAVDRRNGERVAIKIMNKARVIEQGMLSKVKREIAIMKKISHPHVVQLKEVLASDKNLYMVLELVPGGELFHRLAQEGRFQPKQARRYFRQLISGLKYVHSQGICHRDLKPENLLIDDDTDCLKISDFGLSALHEIVVSPADADAAAAATTTDADAVDAPPQRTQSAQGMCFTRCGTQNYVAPEVLCEDYSAYDGFKADIWSCGVILFVFLSGRMPFDRPSIEELHVQIRTADVVYPRHFSASARDLLAHILDPDPIARYDIPHIESHRWYRKTSSPVSHLSASTPTLPVVSPLPPGLSTSPPPPPPPSISSPSSSRSSSSSSSTSLSRSSSSLSRSSSSLPCADALGTDELPASKGRLLVGDAEIDAAWQNVDDEPRGRKRDGVDSSRVLVGGVSVTNAFELIALSGALDLTALLDRNHREQYARTHTRFPTRANTDVIIRRLTDEMKSRPWSLKVYPASHIVVSAFGTLGCVSFDIQVLYMAPDLRMVAFHRKSGNILEFYKYFKELSERCRDLQDDLPSSAKLSPPLAPATPVPRLRSCPSTPNILRSRKKTDEDSPRKHATTTTTTTEE